MARNYWKALSRFSQKVCTGSEYMLAGVPAREPDNTTELCKLEMHEVHLWQVYRELASKAGITASELIWALHDEREK